MTAMVSTANGDSARVEEGEEGVEGGKAGGICYCLAVEDGCEDCF